MPPSGRRATLLHHLALIERAHLPCSRFRRCHRGGKKKRRETRHDYAALSVENIPLARRIPRAINESENTSRSKRDMCISGALPGGENKTGQARKFIYTRA